MEQPALAKAILKKRWPGEKILFSELKAIDFKKVDKVFFWGIGSSYHAAILASYYFEGLAGLSAEFEQADEALRHVRERVELQCGAEVVIGSVAIPYSTRDVAVDGTTAYVSCLTGGVFVVDINAKLDFTEIFKSGFTRIPVIDGDMDHIIGILNIKDLLLQSSGGLQPFDLRQIMREPYFVPEHKKLDRLLQGFKRRKQHLAIVVDEHGGVAGLITLEDALEEIVGEITDETDIIEPTITAVAPGEWRVMGKTEIGEVNEQLQMNIPDTGEYDTFSGYVMNQTGRIPREGEEIPLGEFTAVVKTRKGNRIIEYKVRKRLPAQPLNA